MFRLYQQRIIEYINRGHERSILAKKNVIASLGIKGVTILISFILVPLTINYANSVRYGIWITVYQMVMWMNLLDVGFGNGLKNKLAEAKALGNDDLAKRYVSSVYAIVTLICTTVFITFVFINPFIDWTKVLKSVPSEYYNELTGLIWVCIISFCGMFVLNMIKSVVAADQRLSIGSFFDMISQVLTLIGVYILVKTTPPSLLSLSIVTALSPVFIYLIASFFLFNGRYKKWKPSLGYVDFGLAKKTLKLGVKFFVVTCAAFVLIQTLPFLILYLTTPVEVSNYHIANRLFLVLYNVAIMIISPYWASFTDAYTQKDFTWMKNSISKLYKFFILFFILEVLILFLSPCIYNLWIGDELHISFFMSFAVFLLITSLCWLNINIYPLNGIGKMKIQMYSSFIEIIVMIPLAFWLGAKWGSIGIALSPVIAYIPRMIWAPIQLNKLINQSAKGIWNK